MDAALRIAFYASAIGGIVAGLAAILVPWPRARWLYMGAVVLLVVAGVLGIFSIGIIFLVLAVGFLVSAAVSAARETRSHAGADG